MDKRGGEYHFFYVENCLSDSTEKVREGSLVCFRNFTGSKKFSGQERGERRSILHISVENLFSQSTEKLVDETFCTLENFWYPKMLSIKEGAGVTIFRRTFVVSHCNFTEELFCAVFWENSGGEKVYG